MSLLNIQKIFCKINRLESLHRIYGAKTYGSTINKIQVALDEDYLIVNRGEKTIKYPTIWLRDNCQCKHCFHPTSNSRIINWEKFDTNVKASDVYLKNDGHVGIAWSDNHSSEYHIDWLQERSFLKEDQEQYAKTIYRPKKIEWGREDFNTILKKVDYQMILVDKNHFKTWLENLSVYGVALVTGVPPSFDSCRKLANKIEFIKRTHYGEEFEVKSKPGTSNVAYLSSNLQLHTDLPYYEYKPGVNLLHCVTQSHGSGGDNLLADGHHVAKYMKSYHRKQYDILCKTVVNWEDIAEENGNKFHSIYKSSVICEDNEGEIVRINYSTPQRGSHFNVPPEEVKPWYDALRIFVDLIYAHSTKFKMEEGNILCFDNRRLLHGRTEYEDSKENVRYIIGAYVDWDYIFSRWRILNKM